jgi:hypothetical protein
MAGPATGEINRVDFGVYSNELYLGLAGDKVRIEIEAGRSCASRCNGGVARRRSGRA